MQQLLAAAHDGSSVSLGRLLICYTEYLKLMVSAQLDSRLRGRVSASDVVQEAFVEAHRDFGQFRGQTVGEFVGWLRKIVSNNVLSAVEQHLLAQKRDVRREVSLNVNRGGVDNSAGALEMLLAGHAESPSTCAVRRENASLLFSALDELPADYRAVLELRNIESLPFEEVALRMKRTPGAVRMLWLRALKRLRETLEQREP